LNRVNKEGGTSRGGEGLDRKNIEVTLSTLRNAKIERASKRKKRS